MQKAQAQNIVRETLQNDFDKERFLYFVKNLLNKVDDSKAFHVHGYVPDTYKTFIKTYERLATYTDPTGSKIDILVVYLQKETSLERARTAQRNFIARYLKDRDQKDAGLIAFVSPDPADWRFSLVKMEYKFIESKSGKKKVQEEFTPAKRWSFLVGKNENSHTAQSRLAPIVEDDQTNPTLNQLEDAFNIEKVTKEFFEKYRELFLRVYETLTETIKQHPEIKADFTEKNVNTVDFSKKLLGQIVFLYFLQKKGWFGVPMNKDWGNGDKKFLRTLFEEASGKNKNYFDDYLEPLFYEALAKERDDDFYSRFECKVPFLNGGLFDPISNYDWVNTVIDLPNDIFSNIRKTRDGDTGDGILDIFDRYNFTVKEDEPLEKEVAVDPEMLGKVFENLLEVKDRKSKGTYYTPREIVHYMCEQSLVNYLTANHSNISKEKVKEYLYYSDNINNLGKIKIKGESFTPGQYQELDELLKTIKVIDPACGSGAFLITMLQEIVKLRRFLQLSPDNIKNGALVEDQSPYELKRQTIENNIYGVDIDPGAVEIAKLRLWLSLVVDEDDIKQIKPLPNLDYKIMQGNSLLEEFEGIKLFDEKLLQSPIITADLLDPVNELISKLQNQLLKYYSQHPEWMHKGEHNDKPQEVVGLEKRLRDVMKHNKKIKNNSTEQKDLFSSPYNESLYIREQLENLHKEFFKETNKTRKDDLKRRINNLEWDLIEVTLKEQNKLSTLKKLEEFKRSNTKPFFLWKLNFADVFEEKGGFDVVVANPPYVRADSPDFKVQREAIMQSKNYETLYERWDLFVPFIERGLKLSGKYGFLCYITSNSLLTSKFAFKILEYIQTYYAVQFIDYFDDAWVFEAGVVPVVFGIAREAVLPTVRKQTHSGSFENISKKDEVPLSEFKKLGKDAFKQTPVPFNVRIPTVQLGNICYLSYGLRPNSDERYWRGEFTRDDLVSNTKDKKHPKSYIEGKNLDRYRIDKILYLEWGTDRVPKKLVRQTFPELYEKPKLLRGTMTGGTYDDSGVVCNHSIVVIVRFIDLKGVENKSISGSLKKFNSLPRADLEKISTKFDLKYLLAILNSRFADNFLNGIRRHRLEHYFYPDDFRKLPIADISLKEQKLLVNFVNDILKITKTDDYLKNAEKQAKVRDIEHQIDEMVYKLYGLTPEEIKIVENQK
ncbi:MAG: N-6 DNA methylase [bacterium]|nr:N-6 DNA methylase [bacterium]